VATTEDRDGTALETARAIPVAGDGIVVIPAVDPAEGPRRARILLVGGGIIAILVLVAGIAVAARGAGSTTRVRTSSPSILPSKPLVSKHVAKTRPIPTVPRDKPAATVALTMPTSPPRTAIIAPPASVASPATPRLGVSGTEPPTTAAPAQQYGPSVLTWSAPGSFALPAGTSKLLAVTAHNPTGGTVTLPHPLSCAPRLDHGEMCPEMVQLVGAGQSASASYTIDASGVAKGRYTLDIEGVLTVAVTVS
jgi:hypothetical protein